MDKHKKLITGPHGQLDGDEGEWKQTVHRAEIPALGHCLESFGEGDMGLPAHVEIHIDNANVLAGAREAARGIPDFAAHDGALWADVSDNMPKALGPNNLEHRLPP